jgi:hypothetical protein
VSTLSTIYGIEGGAAHSESLQQALRHDLTPAGAMALLVFFRVRAAVHVDHRRGASGNRRMDLACGPARLYDWHGLRLRVSDKFDFFRCVVGFRLRLSYRASSQLLNGAVPFDMVPGGHSKSAAE